MSSGRDERGPEGDAGNRDGAIRNAREAAKDGAWLFSYGTLRQPEVQRSLFGREVETVDDALPGHVLGTVRITDPSVIATSGSANHPILEPAAADCRVRGAALLLTAEDIEAADRYEVDAYVRVEVRLASGRTAFAYVRREGATSSLPAHPPGP